MNPFESIKRMLKISSTIRATAQSKIFELAQTLLGSEFYPRRMLCFQKKN